MKRSDAQDWLFLIVAFPIACVGITALMSIGGHNRLPFGQRFFQVLLSFGGTVFAFVMTTYWAHALGRGRVWVTIVTGVLSFSTTIPLIPVSL